MGLAAVARGTVGAYNGNAYTELSMTDGGLNLCFDLDMSPYSWPSRAR